MKLRSGLQFCQVSHKGPFWSIIVLSVHKWFFHRHTLRNKTFRIWLCLLSWSRRHRHTLKLQKDIDRLGCWARNWGMRFLPVKCNIMQITRKRTNKIEASYTLEGMVLENVDFIKYLGVTITHDLRWNKHISIMCTKANRTLDFLGRNLYQWRGSI